MITPQAIKDQDFQIKFRGYDAIEVKAFLELLAEDFFELTERYRLLSEELDTLRTEQEFLRQEKESLAAEARLSKESAETVQSSLDQRYRVKDEEISGLREQLTGARQSITDLQQDNEDLRRQVASLEAKLSGEQGASMQEQAEISKLRARIEVLEEQNRELKQQGLDFKTTILAAQKFADNLKQTAEEDTRRMMDKARADVEKFRMEAHAELSRLPKEIEKLNQQRINVRDELKKILQTYLKGLEVFPDQENGDKEDDLADLFQSILLPENDQNDPDDISSIKIDLT